MPTRRTRTKALAWRHQEREEKNERDCGRGSGGRDVQHIQTKSTHKTQKKGPVEWQRGDQGRSVNLEREKKRGALFIYCILDGRREREGRAKAPANNLISVGHYIPVVAGTFAPFLAFAPLAAHTCDKQQRELWRETKKRKTTKATSPPPPPKGPLRPFVLIGMIHLYFRPILTPPPPPPLLTPRACGRWPRTPARSPGSRPNGYSACTQGS